jgi:hypothetical protein
MELRYLPVLSCYRFIALIAGVVIEHHLAIRLKIDGRIGNVQFDLPDTGQVEIDSLLMDGPEDESDAVEDVSRPVSRNTRIVGWLVGIGEKSDTVEKMKKLLGTKGGVFQFRPRNNRARNVHFQAEANNGMAEFLASIGVQTGRT